MSEFTPTANSDKKALGRRLRSLREGHGLTLDELSQSTKLIDPEQEGVSKVSISRYENADSYPGYREIRLLAQAIGVSITFLFYGDAPDPYGGGDFSLDEYLRSVIKDVLIEEGLVPGESRGQRERKKRDAMRAIEKLANEFTPSKPHSDEVNVMRKQELKRLKAQAKGASQPVKK